MAIQGFVAIFDRLKGWSLGLQQALSLFCSSQAFDAWPGLRFVWLSRF